MKTKESITLSDVAKAAGVSPATVSRVINKHVQINSRTRTKVFNAIQRLGYNTASIEKKAAAIAQSKTKVLNVEFLLFPLAEQKNMLSLEHFNEISNGIQSFFTQTGNIRMHICTWNSDEDKYHDENEIIFKRLLQADGVLITGTPNYSILKRMEESGIKTVLISSDRENISMNTVGSDDLSGGMQAARYLIENGHKHIGFLSGPEQIYSWTARRMGAMLETIKLLGNDCFTYRESVSTEITDIAETFRQWIDEGNMPRAIIMPAAHSVMALERVLLERGLSCPEDISLVSFDTSYPGTFHIKPAHLKTFPKQMGIKAAQRLIQMLNFPHSEEKPHKVVIPMEFEEGNSVKKMNKSN